jgi:uroporphyrinogen-III synthase
MSQPLAGLGVLVTRPADLVVSLESRLKALGARPVRFPTLAILPPRDGELLARQLSRLADFDLAIFASPTAVARGLAAVGVWPANLTAAGVGQGSAEALRVAGVNHVLAPIDGADSEHLLAMPVFAEMGGQRVLILRGDGGRALLADTLRARGAEVEYAECYRRGLPQVDAEPLRQEWRDGGIQAVTVLSSEGLDNLFTLLGTEYVDLVRSTPLFAPHPRIVEHAHARGVHMAVATAPGETGLLEGLVEYFAYD